MARSVGATDHRRRLRLATAWAVLLVLGLVGLPSVPGGAQLPTAARGSTPDFDGDGRTDIAVFRPSVGVWFVRQSSNGTTSIVQFGTFGDVPVPGDFDGDGMTDIAVFRPSVGVWFVRQSSNGTTSIVQYGTSGDEPIRAVIG